MVNTIKTYFNMKPKIELSKTNIERWKYVLNSYMKFRLKLDKYADTCSDEMWLEMFEGQTAIDVYIDYITTD